MKIKLDENMPGSLVSALQRLGYDIHTVQEEGLAGTNDDEIWAAAQTEDRFLITQDLDFSDIRKFAPGTHAGILVVRLRNPGRILLQQFVAQLFVEENPIEWARCFVIATERKIRIHRP